MQEPLLSEGKCLYCQQLFSQKEITKHLATHLQKMEKENILPKAETYCHIKIEAAEMFLHLLVKGSALLYDIDIYLRLIWMECCGHLSGFSIKRDEIEIDEEVEDVFIPNAKLTYDYDFGTTTTVDLKAHKHYQLALKEPIILLSRNEPLKLLCVTCNKKMATSICTVCNWDSPALFCNACAKKHEKICDDFADYANLPFVNSPRVGECGYMGGTIDLDRDGVYKKQ